MRTLNVRLAVTLMVGTIIFGAMVHAATTSRCIAMPRPFSAKRTVPKRKQNRAQQQGNRVNEQKYLRLQIQNLNWYVEMPTTALRPQMCLSGWAS